MRIFLKFVLDCEPDAAWSALRSPAVFRAVARPFTTFESLEPAGFPAVWTAGPHPVRAKALGLFGMGDQTIDISFVERPDGVRIVIDSGGATSGPLTLITYWRHSMAVSPAPGGGTLYRDQLVFRAGFATPVAWFGLWVFWQWRGARIRRLANDWRV
jgi:hypothetical protein